MAARTISRRYLRMFKNSTLVGKDFSTLMSAMNTNAILWGNLRDAILGVCSKLDADGGVTDANYTATAIGLTGMLSTADSFVTKN